MNVEDVGCRTTPSLLSRYLPLPESRQTSFPTVPYCRHSMLSQQVTSSTRAMSRLAATGGITFPGVVYCATRQPTLLLFRHPHWFIFGSDTPESHSYGTVHKPGHRQSPNPCVQLPKGKSASCNAAYCDARTLDRDSR